MDTYLYNEFFTLFRFFGVDYDLKLFEDIIDDIVLLDEEWSEDLFNDLKNKINNIDNWKADCKEDNIKLLERF